MDAAIIFDCEFLTVEGALTRFWCGPNDPDPTVVQIGAVKLALADGHAILERLKLHVTPLDRHGRRHAIDPYLTELTGITADVIDREGTDLQAALGRLAEFAGPHRLWSWGKDELSMIATSCYVAGIAPPIPARRFDNACKLLLKAGMPYEDLIRTRSSGLASYFHVPHPPLRAHDALDDAMSITLVLQHLLRAGRLAKDDFTGTGRPARDVA
ncbi:exonuclease [Rhizobium sp. TRM95111]|uniref:exonuclease domain-containing protein n=1 Tax=Rhizobium alarense TaxID=2846851 RepID=UPI001F242705|nr:exonuclease domain-containing protein [Rhizobium alarense]MCF3643073.1 exonuclease [Rhizobium alarense]